MLTPSPKDVRLVALTDTTLTKILIPVCKRALKFMINSGSGESVDSIAF